MNRPKHFKVGTVIYWTIRTRNPNTSVLKDADSTPTVAVWRGIGSRTTGDSVTVTKRSATTGIYDCAYDPASEIEGEIFTVEETVTVTGTSTPQATYSANWEIVCAETISQHSGTAQAGAAGLQAHTGVGDAQAAASVLQRIGANSYAASFFAAVSVMISIAYARPTLGSRDMLKGEFFTLTLFVLLGISVMTSANNFLVVYLGLELMSLSLYALTALRRDHGQSTEAAMKYLPIT